jgi:Zn-dependent peptidase ImmA (M78 family)
MQEILLKTRTARYFLGLFGENTILDAAEEAAERERVGLLPGLHDFSPIPVELDKIVQRKGIRHGPDLSIDSPENAILIPRKKGYLLRLNPKLTKYRKRFTIAHEIGHTLFYRNMKHQINVLDKKELETEEKICDLFAGSLLMPLSHISNLITHIPNENPWKALNAIESASQYFRVSIPALISRIGTVNKSKDQTPYIVLHFHIKENRYTGEDRRPRVRSKASLGKFSNITIWDNQSFKSLNLQSVEDLFSEWKKRLIANKEPSGGRFILGSRGILMPAVPDELKWVHENGNFCIRRGSKWYEEKFSVLTASCLYALKGWDENQAYIISIIKGS